MKIYNTLTGKKEDFQEIEKGKVKMYVCGPTVYNYIHIGNARPFVIFEAFRNYLEYRGYDVTFVQNFTDVDDKIIKRANEENITPKEVADKYIEEYFKDVEALGIRKADYHPRVTETIDDIIKFIEDLEEKGYAYRIGSDVYFDTKKDKEYGKLSGKNIDDLIAGARIDVNEDKKNPTDFALWKEKKEGEIGWDSPWGVGRPGWHIECSVMSWKYLGETIDIHAGGQDLIFPHHENEIAQSECRSGKEFARYWMHNGYINVDNVKMSKSLGNFFTVRDVLKKIDGKVVRFFILLAHYRGPVNYSKELLDSAEKSLSRITNCKENLKFLKENSDGSLREEEKSIVEEIDKTKENYINHLDDDFNTADAISDIFDLVKIINSKISEKSSKELIEKASDMLDELTEVLNIANIEEETSQDDTLIEKMIEERNQAKKDKDYDKADKIRAELLDMGITIEDTRAGTKWKRR